MHHTIYMFLVIPASHIVVTPCQFSLDLDIKGKKMYFRKIQFLTEIPAGLSSGGQVAAHWLCQGVSHLNFDPPISITLPFPQVLM